MRLHEITLLVSYEQFAMTSISAWPRKKRVCWSLYNHVRIRDVTGTRAYKSREVAVVPAPGLGYRSAEAGLIPIVV